MRALLRLGFAALILLLPVLSSDAAGDKTHEVIMVKNALKLAPEELTIQPGDTVKWRNTDTQKHNLASVPGSGPTDELEIFSLMEPGDVYSHTFKTPGDYPYFCFIHNQMTGKITVVAK